MNLNKASRGINYNVHMLRFCAACMVIIGHAFILAAGQHDWISNLTRHQTYLGKMAVAIFFAFSGFYVTKSILKHQDAKQFFKARVTRLFPPLAVVVMACVFVLGPIMTTLPLKEYFSSGQTYLYLLNICLIPVHTLPGVFQNCVADTTVNGALWTMPVEFLCCVCVLILFKLKILNQKKMHWSIPLFLVLAVASYGFAQITGYKVIASMMSPITSFYVGCLLCVYADKIDINYTLAGVCVLILVGATFLGILKMAVDLVLPVLVITLALRSKQVSKRFEWGGSISYGMYLVGFPIQMTLISLFGGTMNAYLNFLLAIPLDIAFAYMVYCIGEKPFSKKKTES